MEEMQDSQSDVQESTGQVESPAPSESSAPSQDSTAEQGSAAQTEQNTPFHMHPRFQELIQERKQQAAEIQELRRQMQSVQQQAPSQKQEDALIARLKQIDPEFGSRIEKYESQLSKLDQFEQWQQQQQMQAIQQQAYSSLDNLYKQHQVPDNLKKRYEREIKAIATENPNIGLKDLPQVFKEVHDEYQSMLNEFKRKERESYVSEKNAGKTPASVSNGTAPASGKSNEGPQTLDDVKAQIARELRQASNKI